MLPHEEKPSFGNDLVAVTRETASMVSGIFNRMVERGVPRDSAQRFILQAVMAMFSEDIGLLPRHFFSQAVTDVQEGKGSAYDLLFGLFREMNARGETSGGRFEGTPFFNGGLFATVDPFDLVDEEVEALGVACKENWAAVRPVIFGTLFEQSLDKPERHAFGAYFTSEADMAASSSSLGPVGGCAEMEDCPCRCGSILRAVLRQNQSLVQMVLPIREPRRTPAIAKSAICAPDPCRVRPSASETTTKNAWATAAFQFTQVMLSVAEAAEIGSAHSLPGCFEVDRAPAAWSDLTR